MDGLTPAMGCGSGHPVPAGAPSALVLGWSPHEQQQRERQNSSREGRTQTSFRGTVLRFLASSHVALSGWPPYGTCLNATPSGLSSLPPSHSCCNGKILIRPIEKVNRKCPTSEVFPKDTWRRSWRNCLLVTKH